MRECINESFWLSTEGFLGSNQNVLLYASSCHDFAMAKSRRMIIMDKFSSSGCWFHWLGVRGLYINSSIMDEGVLMKTSAPKS